MDRLTIREMFVKQVGRFDLVGTQSSGGNTVPDYSVDNGAEALLNSAVRWLDQQTKGLGQKRVKVIPLEAGDTSIAVDRLIMPLKAAFRSATAVSPLDIVQYEDLLDNVESPLAQVEVGLPLCIAHMPGADTEDLDADDPNADFQPMTEDHEKLFIVYPPTETAGYIEVVGYFYSRPLGEEDEDGEENEENWWTINEASAVINAAAFMLYSGDLNPATIPTVERVINGIIKRQVHEAIHLEILAAGDC